MKLYVTRLAMLFFYLVSHLSIRDKKIWVFGSYGVFNDNSKYLFLKAIREKNIRAIWIAKNEYELNEVKKYTNLCYLRYSIKGIYFSLRAKVYVYSAYVTDINYCTSGNAICINLWHGIPLKKIEFDIKKGDISHIFNKSIKSKFLYPWVYRKPNFLLSPSSFVAEYSFRKAFEITDRQIILNDYPRVIALKDMQSNFIKEDDRFIFLYAPTWRDANPKFLNQDNLVLDIIENFCLKNNSTFVIKLHSNSNFDINIEKYKFIKIINNTVDSNQVMVMSDCLITDYSSIYFDYLELDKPIIFYRFDEAEYMKKSREFYSEIYNFIPGAKAENFNDLICLMIEIVNNKNVYNHLSVGLKNKLTSEKKEIDLIKHIINKIKM